METRRRSRTGLQEWNWLFPVLLLAIAAGLAVPIMVYLKNFSWFSVKFRQILPYCALSFAAILAGGVGVGLLILYWRWIREKLGEYSYFAFGALIALSFMNLTSGSLLPIAVLPLIGLAAGLILRKWDNESVFGALIALAIANWVQTWCPGLVPPLMGLAAGLLLRKWEQRYTYLLYGAMAIAGLVFFLQNKYPLITLFVWGAVLGMMLKRQIRPIYIYADIVFGLALAVIAQIFLANEGLQELSNSQPSWNNQSSGAALSLHLWGLCLILPSVIRLIDKKLISTVRKYGSVLLSVALIIALGVQYFTVERKPIPIMTKDDEFVLSTRDNVVVFLVDSLDAQYVEDYVLAEDMRLEEPETLAEVESADAGTILELWGSDALKTDALAAFLNETPEVLLDEIPAEEPEEYAFDAGMSHELLDGFTYFDNVVGGGAPSWIGIPTLLTGAKLTDYESDSEYFENAFAASPLFRDLKKRGYNVRVYSGSGVMLSADVENIDNIRTDLSYEEISSEKSVSNLFRLIGYCALPYQLKPKLWTPGSAVSDNVRIATPKVERYWTNDSAFYADYSDNGLTLDEEGKCFVVYHLRGAVAPYNMNEQSQKVNEQDTSQARQIAGVFNIIYQYVQGMKEADIYDDSTIIIAGTNGDLELGQNPAVLIKRRHETAEGFVRNSTPLTFKNLRASLVDGIVPKAKKKYGYNMFNQPAKKAPLLREHVAGKDYWQKLYSDNGAYWREFRITDVAVGQENILKTVEFEPYEYTLNEWIPLCGEDVTEDIPIRGVSIDEQYYRWSLGQDITIGLKLEKPVKKAIFDMPVVGTINCTEQPVQVYVNDQLMYDEAVTMNTSAITFTIPEEVAPEGIYNIVMKIPDAISPIELGINEDERMLALMLTGFGMYSPAGYYRMQNQGQ